jgi:hypothetical protein
MVNNGRIGAGRGLASRPVIAQRKCLPSVTSAYYQMMNNRRVRRRAAEPALARLAGQANHGRINREIGRAAGKLPGFRPA